MRLTTQDSAMNGRPFVLGLDLDGVCVDYVSSLRRVVADRRGVPAETLPFPQHWDFRDWGFVSGDFIRYHRAAVEEERVFLRSAPIAGAVDAVRRLHSSGVKIHIVTHRQGEGVDKDLVAQDTTTWLALNDLPHDRLHFVSNKSTIPADVYLEDAPHAIQQLRDSDRQVFVFDQPYNSEVAGPRVRGWAEAERAILNARG